MVTLETIYKKTKNGAIQEWSISFTEEKDGTSTISIRQGKFRGKMQTYTEVVKEGKQNRTIFEQSYLEIESRWNKKKDEGYKTAEETGWNEKSNSNFEEWLLNNLPDDRTDANGVLKPMKCTLIEKGLKKIKFPAYAQPKLDGVRGFVRWDGEQWRATSSSGKSYDIMARHILDELNNYDSEELKLSILDGEFYIHGTPLEYLSGWARTQTRIPEHNSMQFHIFDIPDKLFSMKMRRTLLRAFAEKTSFEYIRFVETQQVDDIEQFDLLHDTWVRQGYEGAILRNFDGKYEFGIRSTDIFKKKDFKDEEFEIIGMELGSRGTEDMVFICMSKNGEFRPNPVGNRKMKEEYWNNISKIVGKKAMVRYLTLSHNGIPQGNPIMKAIRDYE